MPRDISSSSSEDEAENSSANTHEKQKQNVEKPTRYQCPADFVSFCHKPCSSTLTESLNNNNNELWLIKAPANFKAECFSGVKVPLSGLKKLKVPAAAGGGQQVYSVMASTHGASDLCLLTSDKPGSDNHVYGPAFSGLLNVCENFGGSGDNQAPHVIPAVPAPSIPPGLKQRFHPFGSKPPAMTDEAESEVDGASFGPWSTTLSSSGVKRSVRAHEDEEEEEEGRKKKKKKKKNKEKESRAEQADELMQEIKIEPESDAEEEKRKKNKKKKDRERHEVEEGVEPDVTVKMEDVTVKSEPIDTLYEGGAEGSGKKKKKKKKSKSADD